MFVRQRRWPRTTRALSRSSGSFSRARPWASSCDAHGRFAAGPTLNFLGGDRCKRGVVAFAGADANDLLQRLHEDFSVTDFSCSCRLQNRVDGRLDERRRACHLDLYLLAELEHDRRAAVMLQQLLLATVTDDACNGDASHSGLEQRFLDRAQSLGADDAANEFHQSLRIGYEWLRGAL